MDEAIVRDQTLDCRYCHFMPNVTVFPIKEDDHVRYRVTIECKGEWCPVHPMVESGDRFEAITMWNKQQTMAVPSAIC